LIAYHIFSIARASIVRRGLAKREQGFAKPLTQITGFPSSSLGIHYSRCSSFVAEDLSKAVEKLELFEYGVTKLDFGNQNRSWRSPEPEQVAAFGNQ